MPVTIYLTDEQYHEQVESAVETLLVTAGLRIVDRDDPVFGSWFRRMTARAKDGLRSPASQDAALTAAHALDTRLNLGQDAEVTAKLLANLGPVISCAAAGQERRHPGGGSAGGEAGLDEISVMQLTAAQQARLDHRQQLDWSPRETLAALSDVPDHGSGPAADDAARLDLYVEKPVLGQDSRFLREAGVSFGRPRVAPVPDDELPVADQRWIDLPGIRVFEITLPFDLEEPPDGCRYTETTVKMSFDDPGVVARRLSRPPAGAGENGADDSMLDTRGVGRQQLTWKLSARDEQSGLRPSGREVQAVLGAPIAAEQLTGTLDARIRFTRPESGGGETVHGQAAAPAALRLGRDRRNLRDLPGGELLARQRRGPPDRERKAASRRAASSAATSAGPAASCSQGTASSAGMRSGVRDVGPREVVRGMSSTRPSASMTPGVTPTASAACRGDGRLAVLSTVSRAVSREVRSSWSRTAPSESWGSGCHPQRSRRRVTPKPAWAVAATAA